MMSHAKTTVAAYEALVAKAVRIVMSMPNPERGWRISRPDEHDAEDFRLTIDDNGAELHWIYPNYEGGYNQLSERFHAHYLELDGAAFEAQIAALEIERDKRKAAETAKYEKEREERERATLRGLLARYGASP